MFLFQVKTKREQISISERFAKYLPDSLRSVRCGTGTRYIVSSAVVAVVSSAVGVSLGKWLSSLLSASLERPSLHLQPLTIVVTNQIPPLSTLPHASLMLMLSSHFSESTVATGEGAGLHTYIHVYTCI